MDQECHVKKKVLSSHFMSADQAIFLNCNPLQTGYQISPNHRAALNTKFLFLLLNTIKELKRISGFFLRYISQKRFAVSPQTPK